MRTVHNYCVVRISILKYRSSAVSHLTDTANDFGDQTNNDGPLVTKFLHLALEGLVIMPHCILNSMYSVF